MRPSTLLAFLPLAMAAPSPAPIKRDSPAPLITPRGNKGVPNRFIIRMVDGIKESSMSSSMKSLKTSSHFKYSKSFNGFAATLDEDQLAAIRENPNVEYVEQEQVMQIYETQQDATWGISRLSSQTPGATTYSYDAAAGEGTCAYVLDTGIDVAHPEFEGRATWAANFASGNSTRDVQGHGTHCAGTIGSKTYGVAKKTKLFAVKVLGDDGSGTTSGVVAGMEWVVKNADKSKCPNGIVINMSLGGSYSRAINDAAAAITDSGFFLAVAAGNSAVDASTSSPASEPKACTVGASDSSDKIAYFSNFGKLVDIFAPGVKIESTFPGGRTKAMNGTSMASPHVAGLGAYLLSIGQKADGLCDYIAKTGLKNAISGVPNGTVSTLANNGFSAQ